MTTRSGRDMETKDDQILELRKLVHGVLNELDEGIREIRYPHVKSILKKKFDVKCSLRDIRGIFCDGRCVLSIGWGRGENYLHRIPPDFKRIDNMV